MPRRLPPLNALRAFEAAARHLSFTRAAHELHVSQGAVSRQVKALEDYLQVPLFKRANRSIVITEEGQAFMSALGKAFDMIDHATSRLRARSEQGLLTVRVLPTLAMRWLIPRLHKFYEVHPQIEVRITTSSRPGDFASADVDVVIGRKPDCGPGLRCDVVMREDLIVVCSPSLLSGKRPLRQPADLANKNLLHALTRPEAWRVWLEGASVGEIDPDAGLRFEHYYFAIQAAIGGLGVLAVPRPLVSEDLATGQLVAPFDISVPSDDNYYLIYPENRSDLPKLQAFRKWILTIAGTSHGT
ncbi:MAG: transcriptional regulator GcvA [Betaproteobacteria bacterium]|nr:transcriptional regulator GcvA [Betaproteobacteria bacterium]